MLVEQLGNKNQFKVFTKNGTVFQSYSSLIAFKSNSGHVFLTGSWDKSATTLKHLKIFLNIALTKKQIQKNIDGGVYEIVEEYKLRDLALNH